MAECSLNGLKTVCEKEKLLVTSNFQKTCTAGTWKPELVWERGKSSQENKISDSSEWKAFADVKLGLTRLMEFVWKKKDTKHLLEKGENGNIFLPFHIDMGWSNHNIICIILFDKDYMCAYWLSLSLFSKKTKFRPFKTHRLCRRQYQIWWQKQKGLKRVENTLGKGETGNQHFLLFP